MKVITYEKFITRFPIINNQINIDEMDRDTRGFYFTMYSLYSDYLERFLIKHTNIKKVDDAIRSNPLFSTVSSDDKDFYQELSVNLKYLYIRNNIHIENLDKNENKFLANKIINDDFAFDTSTEDFMAKTYKKVISELPLEDNEAYINYGPEVEYFYAPSNSLVIGLRFNEENNNDFVNRKITLEDYITLLENDIAKKLNIGVKVIIYDSHSIKKKDKMSKLK